MQNLGSSVEAAYDIGLQSTARIVTVGSTGGSLRLTRYLGNGTLDASFGTAGTVVFPFAGLEYAGVMGIDSSDRIVVAGRINDSGDTDVFAARFTADGAIDTTFGGGDGWISFDYTAATTGAGNESAIDVIVDSSDRPIIGGFADANGLTFNPSNSDMAVARLTTAGALDPTFGTGGLASASSPGTANDDDIRGLTLDGSGRIVAIGSTAYPNAFNSGPRNTILARWLSTGTLDTTFDGDGVLVQDMSEGGTDDYGIDVGVDSTGKILALGQGTDDPIVARLLDSGGLDTGFAGDGIVSQSFVGTQDTVEHVLIQADDKVLVTGWPIVGAGFHFAVMRLTTAGVLDPTWSGDGVATTTIASNESGYAALIQPDQRVILAGAATGETFMALARYLNDASVISSTVTTITADAPDPSALNATVPIAVSVSANSGSAAPTGTVDIGDGVDSCTATLTPGAGTTATGSCNLTFTTLGPRTVTAPYGGTSAFCKSSDTEPHDVFAPTTTTSITSDLPDPTVVGQPFLVQYSVSSSSPGTITGNVVVSDGTDSCNATVAAGQCSLTLTTAGNRMLVATYGGDMTYGGSFSSGAPHVVNQASTATAITNDTPDPSVVGESLTVSWAVSVAAPGNGTPTGTVMVSDGTDSCGGTVASAGCTIALTTPGARTLTATYSGDASFNGSSDTEDHAVDPAATTVTIANDTPDPSVVGESFTVSWAVNVASPGNGTPTGTVMVSDGTDSCSGTVASASCMMALTTPGARTLTATYSGDASFNGSSDTEDHQADPAATTLTVTVSPNPATVGQLVTVSFNVAVIPPGAGAPDGMVTIDVGSAGGCAANASVGSCSFFVAAPGSFGVNASYPGSPSFAPSTGSGPTLLTLAAINVPTLDDSMLALLGLLLALAGAAVLRGSAR